MIPLTDAVVGALKDHTVFDAPGQCDLGVDQVLQRGVRITIGKLVAELQQSERSTGQGARTPALVALTLGSPPHEVEGTEELATAPEDAQCDVPDEMHARVAVRQVTTAFPQGFLGQSQGFVLFPTLRPLEQPGQ